jgi:hypothetical protein
MDSDGANSIYKQQTDSRQTFTINSLDQRVVALVRYYRIPFDCIFGPTHALGKWWLGWNHDVTHQLWALSMQTTTNASKYNLHILLESLRDYRERVRVSDVT